jgi:hypothetical protein
MAVDAKDVAERDKVSRTLDLDAFLSFHKRNTTSAKYWETPE